MFVTVAGMMTASVLVGINAGTQALALATSLWLRWTSGAGG